MPRKLLAKLTLMTLLVTGTILSVPGKSEAFPCYCDDGTYVGDFSTVRACANACYPA